jgi:POT family proton-dependent oligopeptide transporter
MFRTDQPKGLYPLFFTELWERFGFYMVQTIIILYLTKGLFYSDHSAYLLYGAFTSMLYLSPVVGGYVADRYIGFRQSIRIGAVLFLAGYFLMSFHNQELFFLGLSLVVMGNGFFKPNVSGIVGELYHKEDPRRDGGFTLFYMGINIGSLIPPIFAGALVAAYAWGSGFLVAAVGILIAIITFAAGEKKLGDAGLIPSNSPLKKSKTFQSLFYVLLLAAIFIGTGVLYLLLHHPQEANIILVIASLSTISGVLLSIFKQQPHQRRKMVACLILIVLSVGFWAIYNQTFTSLMLFADRNMSKELLGFTIDAEFTQFFNPLFIILLSPFLSWLWVRLDHLKKNPSTPLKFSLGILFMSIGFFSLSWGVGFNHNGLASPWWLILSYFLQTCGELLISPIGLAMVTRLAPPHLVGVMMGVWFLSLSAAYGIGGGLATLSDVPKDLSGAASLAIYSHAFLIYGSIALALAILAFILTPYLNRLIGHTDGPIITPKR